MIRINRPVVILDEGHNAQTSLSFDMLKRMSPSVILELTATPRDESNILVDVQASELKAEKMVKIPLYLTNVSQWQEAVRDGIAKRNELDKIAKAEFKATPIYTIQVEGKVVVAITVDRLGNVITAIPGVKGSTTLNKELLQRAKTAALKTKFEPKQSAPTNQQGKIIYYFQLN